MKFCRESDWHRFYIQSQHLFKENNKEINFFNKELDVNDQLYNYLMNHGGLVVYTIRDGEDVYGYSVYSVGKHPHHVDMILATQDTIFITKRYRGHGLSFLSYCDRQLRDMGVDIALRQVSKFNNWSLLLNRLNYEEVETVYMKDLRMR